MTGDDGGEGTAGGDCRDGADNDDDGLFDCDDDGCGASPDCEGSDENAAPSGAAIAIEPATPGDDDDLVCTIVTEATDPNGDPVSYTFAWARTGADAGVSGATVGAALTTGGDTWTCTVTPNDGVLDGAPTSVSVTIAQGNRAPSAPTVSISPAAPADDDVLTCVIDTESVDPDGDTLTYAYAWSVDGADAGVSSATVNAALTEVGQAWTCVVTASDGELESSSGSASVDIGATTATRNCASLDIDGGPSYATAPDSPDFDLGTSFTLEAWIHLLPTTDTSIGVLSKPRASDGTGIVLGPEYLGILGDTGACVAGTYITGTDTGWVHVAGTYDGAALRVYVNGILTDSTACSVVPGTSTQAFQIGREFEDLGGRYFKGRVSVSRVWSVPLTAAQILTGMDPDAVVGGAGLVAEWRLDEGTGAALTDSTGNGHDALYSDALAWSSDCP